MSPAASWQLTGTPFLQELGCGALVQIHPGSSGGYGGLHTSDLADGSVMLFPASQLVGRVGYFHNLSLPELK